MFVYEMKFVVCMCSPMKVLGVQVFFEQAKVGFAALHDSSSGMIRSFKVKQGQLIDYGFVL